MSVVPGLPSRGPRPPTGAVVIPFPVPPGRSRTGCRPVPARHAPARQATARQVPVPLRLTRRGRAVVTVVAVFVAVALLAAAVVLLPRF